MKKSKLLNTIGCKLNERKKIIVKRDYSVVERCCETGKKNNTAV